MKTGHSYISFNKGEDEYGDNGAIDMLIEEHNAMNEAWIWFVMEKAGTKLSGEGGCQSQGEIEAEIRIYCERYKGCNGIEEIMDRNSQAGSDTEC